MDGRSALGWSFPVYETILSFHESSIHHHITMFVFSICYLVSRILYISAFSPMVLVVRSRTEHWQDSSVHCHCHTEVLSFHILTIGASWFSSHLTLTHSTFKLAQTLVKACRSMLCRWPKLGGVRRRRVESLLRLMLYFCTTCTILFVPQVKLRKVKHSPAKQALYVFCNLYKWVCVFIGINTVHGEAEQRVEVASRHLSSPASVSH